MVKKFNEYLKENKDITKILFKEEIEDQFLKLKETFNCGVSIIDFPTPDRYFIYVTKISFEKFNEILKEIERIKRRIEAMFPLLNMRADLKGNAPEYSSEIRTVIVKIMINK